MINKMEKKKKRHVANLLSSDVLLLAFFLVQCEIIETSFFMCILRFLQPREHPAASEVFVFKIFSVVFAYPNSVCE